MGTLTGCLKKAGAAIHADDKADILERARILKAEGAQSPAEQAIDEQLAKVRAMIAELGGAADESVAAPENPEQKPSVEDHADHGHLTTFSRSPTYAIAVDAVLDGTKPESEAVRVSGSLPVLDALGMPSLPLATTGDRLSKMHFDHGLTRTDLKSLPDLLAEPVMAFRSASIPGSQVLVLDLWRRGMPVIAAIRPNMQLKRGDVNLLASAYPKDKPNQLGAWFQDGLLLYADKQKTRAWATNGGVQFPWLVQLQRGSGKTVLGPEDVVKPDTRSSRNAESKTSPIPRTTTDSIVAKIRKAFPRAPDIVVHDFIEDAPKALQDRIDSAGARDDVEAAYHDGKIHVFPQNISSAERMEFVVGRHEIRHAGLDGLLGSRKSAFLRDLYDQNAGLKKAADAKVRDGLASSRDVAVEEALADMPTEAIEALTGWDKAVATIRSALRMLADVLKARGLNRLSKAVNPKGWTDKEIAALVNRAEDMSRAGEGKTETLFSRAPAVSDPKSTAIDVRREKSAWRDSLGRSQFAPGAWAYNKVAPFVNERILAPLKLNAMPPELRTQVRAMKLQIQASKDVAVRVAGEGFKLSEQDRVLVSDIIEGELAAGTIPPEHAMRMAAGINTIMDQQTNDLVELGMLAKDSAERWRGAYLPRFYKSKLMQTLREGGADLWGATLRKSARKPAVMQGIKGDSLKGRGLWETVPASELASWEAMGWEVRDPDYEAGVSPDVQMWRDYSREERDKMGEIRDAGFRFTMGYLRTQRDIAMGRMFAGIAEDKSLSAKEGRQPANWVQVPDGSIPGTGGVKRYGKLAGMYVAPEVMNHLENHDQGASEALKLYRKALGMWKEGKVVLNPVSHANNMMGNVSMAHFAGVSYWDAHKYAGTINDLVRKSPMVEEARKAGLFLGTMSQEELLTTMPPELRAMAAMQASKAEKSADFVWNVLSMWLRKPAGKLYEAEDLFFRYLIYRDARNQGLSAEDAVDYSQRYIFTYDDLPKGAQQVRDFAVPFFAYTYKAVPALLHTATHYPHRFLAPAGVMWGLNAAMYALAAGDDDEDWTDKILTYINDPERRKKAEQIESGERENLPPWMKGNSSVLGSPKAVRLGLDEVTGLPMFWDIAQIMPGGNLFDVENNSGGIGWPQSIMPSHPLLTATAAMFWNKDTFFGKDIVDADDTTGEASQKRATWLWKQITPAIAIGNYHTERLANVVAQMTGEPVTWFPRDATGVGKDGLPVQPKLAAMQTVGIKVRPIDVDMSQQINEGQRAKMIRDIDAEIRRINRLSQKGAMSDRNADTEIELQQTKKDRLREGLTVDGEQPK